MVKVIKSRSLRWVGHEGRNAFKMLTGKPTGKRPFREDNIRKDLKGIGIETKNWVDSVQDRGNWNAALNFRVS